jgi:hypothetical protein
MRALGAITALVVAGSLGAVAGAVPAATGDGQAQTCQSSTSSTQTTTTTPTTTTTTTTTTPTTTTTTPAITLSPHGHPLNDVTVENCNDGTVKARSHLQVGRASPVNADPGNFAIAYAHDCSTTGCDAIAAAFQVALIPQRASRQVPENLALAINYKCSHCGAFAYAYQYAVDVPRGTRLPGTTRRQIAAIRREAAADVHASLTFPELDGKLQALAGRLKAAVDAGLQKQHVRETRRHVSHHLKEEGHRSSS